MTRFWPVVVGLTACWLLAGDAAADIVFPARLDVTEREPGVYDVFFSLPIVEGRKLRAEPRLPITCRELSERVAGLSSGGYSSTWTVRCDPASLAGEAIYVDGLLGTQTDLAFTLKTLDGRTYARILRPSRPGFLVPEPPTLVELAGQAIGAGLRRTLRDISLWVLAATAVLLGVRRYGLVAAAATFAVGYFVAQWLGGRGWLEVATPTRDAVVWAMMATGAIRLAGANHDWRAWRQPPPVPLLLLGLLWGGARSAPLPTDGLSHNEQLLALALCATGAAAALLVMVAAAAQLGALIGSLRSGDKRSAALRLFGYVVGGIAVGLLFAQLTGVAIAAGQQPRASLELLLLAIVLGPVAVVAESWVRWVLPAIALSAVGVAFGLSRAPLPLASLLTLGTLLSLGLALATGPGSVRPWVTATAAAALLVHTWVTALSLAENVSRSTALTGGVLLTALCLFVASYAAASRWLTADLPNQGTARSWRAVGAAVALIAVIWRLAEYHEWFTREVATEASLGVLRLPLLSLALLFTAVLIWPRRRLVARTLGIERRSGGLHWLAVSAAFLLLPHGNIDLRVPFTTAAALRGDDARRVLTSLLAKTYHAFNLADEDALYNALAENVTGDLVDDLYLDSRRRLTAGTREGTEVTVREVVVLELGEPLVGADAAAGVSYDCRWAVIARVRHLQHIHHRKNLYNGVLTLRSDGGRWKIGAVELRSEDREVIPWQET